MKSDPLLEVLTSLKKVEYLPGTTQSVRIRTGVVDAVDTLNDTVDVLSGDVVYTGLPTVLAVDVDDVVFWMNTGTAGLVLGPRSVVAGGGGSETAASILAKLITVDGAGSGLDADLLDGRDGLDYYGIVDDDLGATVSGTTSATSLFVDTNLVNPVPNVRDLYTLKVEGAILNVSAGAITSTLSCSFAGNALWTPFALSVAAGEGYQWAIEANYYVRELGTTAVVPIETMFRVVDPDLEAPDPTLWRQRGITPTINNSGGPLNWTLTAQHSTNSAIMFTACRSAVLIRERRAF